MQNRMESALKTHLHTLNALGYKNAKPVEEGSFSTLHLTKYKSRASFGREFPRKEFAGCTLFQ